jgi:hypothetical protein
MAALAEVGGGERERRDLVRLVFSKKTVNPILLMG